MPPFFSTLVLETDEARRRFETHPATVSAIAQGLSAERYRRFLLELYQVVWHFNPVCAAAASRMDDTARSVRYFLYEHMREESGHEVWIANDLRVLGAGEHEVTSYAPSVPTLALCGYNYWSADRRHPCSVLGMLYALEVIASVYCGTFAAALKDSLRLRGEEGVSFISSHATLDSEHLVELKRVLDEVSQDAARAAIIESVRVNFEHLTQIIEAI